MFGRKKLTKADQKHLRENKIYTKYQFEKQVKFLKETREKEPDRPFPCYDCLRIAKKLSMWED